jgi:CopA family copper-resistance protein
MTRLNYPSGGLTRRRFVQSVAVGSGLVTAGGALVAAWPGPAALAAAGAPVLSGTDFQLEISEIPINITGRPRTATAINGRVPGPVLRWREGDTVTLRVTNRLHEPTSIHWHGILLPFQMDGVPGLSFPGIAPGETFVYRFPVRQSGTFWYHSHSKFQLQTGQYAPLVIEPKAGYPQAFDRDYTVILSDWSDETPEMILSNIKFQADYYNYGRRTLGTFIEDVARDGLAATIEDRMMWGEMRMTPTDIQDVTGATYTYLMNGQPPAANWTALFRPGERVRLRFINGSFQSVLDVGIPGLPMTVVNADGEDVVPVTVDQFRFGSGETYDVIVQPRADRAFTIFVQAQDRSGFARGTLAPRPGIAGPVPAMDPRPMRTMADMGMDHGAMGHGSMGGMNHGSMGHGAMTGAAKTGTPAMDHAAMGHGPMGGMNHGAMGHGPMTGAAKTAAPAMDHAAMGHGAMAVMPTGASGQPIALGVSVDNVATMPTQRLDDPGGGFPEGRRVLRYADLRAAKKIADPRPPSREITLHLTGNMERFIWGIDGKKFSEAGPVLINAGERVRITMVNDTMMDHPMHLHGHFMQLENGQGEYLPDKHTIMVKGGERVSFLITAVAGRWAFHCHLSFHMDAGMFREVRIA